MILLIFFIFDLVNPISIPLHSTGCDPNSMTVTISPFKLSYGTIDPSKCDSRRKRSIKIEKNPVILAGNTTKEDTNRRNFLFKYPLPPSYLDSLNSTRYYARLMVGNPPSVFTFAVDTLMKSIIMEDIACSDCKGVKHLYSCRYSRKCVFKRKVPTKYFDSCNLKACKIIANDKPVLVSDEIYFSSSKRLQNQTLTLVFKKLVQNTAVGILGLGKMDALETKIFGENFIHNLARQKFISQEAFSIYMGEKGSELVLGGYDATFLRSKKIFFSPTTSKTEWELSLTAFIIKMDDDLTYMELLAKSAVLSSRHRTIGLPRRDLLIFIGKLNRYFESCSLNNFEFGARVICQFTKEKMIKFPLLLFRFGKNIAKIEPEDYVAFCSSQVDYYFCLLEIEISDLEHRVILGHPFMKHKYLIFLQGKKLIGVVQSRHFYQIISKAEKLWYYTLVILIVVWAATLISCGIYFKAHLNKLNRLMGSLTRLIFCRRRFTDFHFDEEGNILFYNEVNAQEVNENVINNRN